MTSRLGIAITLVAAALLVTSSAGVSTVALERSVEIEVVGDDSAMVGFETNESVGNESPTDALDVTNRAGTTLDIDADADAGSGSDSAVDVDAPEDVGPGETVTISVTGECEGDVELEVTLVGDGIRIERTETLDCDG